MNFVETMLERNANFAETDFAPELKMMPSTGTIILGCVDPRVDPVEVLGLRQGEAAVIRNVGGRVNKPVMETLGLLRVVSKAAGRADGVSNLVLLHHTDCGILSCYHNAPDLLAKHMGVETAALREVDVTDPHKSVAHDIAALRANNQLADTLTVSGLVYDVATGLVEVVVSPAPLREKGGQV